MALSERWRISWAGRRKAKLWVIWFLLSSALAAMMHGLAMVQLPWVQLPTPAATAELASKFGPLVLLRGVPGADWLIALVGAYPQAAVGFFIFGGAAAARWGDRIHDRCLASFNDDVLTRVSELNRPDRDDSTSATFVHLDWTPGTTGPRHQTWLALRNWCESTASPTWNWRTGPTLSLGVLTGRSGSGKSRMGYELARGLAKRDKLGGASPRAVLAARIGIYLRHAVPGLRRRADDPWDAGLLKPARNNTFEYLIGALAEWWPRRPTILLLDDPLRGRTAEVWTALVRADRTRRFRHPVCLLVMNQTVPSDTGLDFDPTSGKWERESKLADPQPFALPIDSWFSPKETLHVAFNTGQFHLKPLAMQKALRENLHRITQGNPLLVELAVEFLRDRDDIEGMTRENLADMRVKRILVALRNRGIEQESQLAAIALATLVGGAPARRIDSELKTLFANWVPLPGFRVLRACFPSDPLTAGDALRIPPVRPDIVGDAFIEQVLPELGTDRAIALAEAGFRIDAGFMLRNLRRARPLDSVMSKALASIDPRAIAGVDPVTLALGFADVAAICQPQDWPLSTAEGRAKAFDAAVGMINRLDAGQRKRFCEGFLDLCAIPLGNRASRLLRSDMVMRLMNTAAEGADVVAAETWIALFEMLEERAAGDLGSALGMALTASSIVPDALADRFATSAWKMGFQWRGGLTPVFLAMAEASAARGAEARSARFSAMAAISSPEEARAAAERAAAIAHESSDDRTLQREAGIARRYETYAWCLVPAGAKALEARAAADTVAAIALRFPDDAAIQREAAEARRYEAYAWVLVPAGAKALEARAVADTVAAIALRFPDDAAIQRAAAEARSQEAYVWNQVPAGAKALEARAAADTVAAIALRFPDDAAIQRAAAEARRYEAYAWRQVPAGAKALEARAAAETVAAIAARFADDATIQRQAADARRYEANAWGVVPAGAKAMEARAAADTVAAIAARFADDPAIQREAAEARRNEAIAWVVVPAGAKAMEARAAADTVAAIAARFADDPAIQIEAAQARRLEAHAWCQVPAGAKALDARDAADTVAAITLRFPHDAAIQREAADARRCEAYAWCHVPNGAKAMEARAAAETVAAIALRFSGVAAIQREAADARGYEAHAWCQVPAGAKALEARAAAETVAAIALRFPDDAAIQRAAADARCSEAYAWTQVPAGAKALEAREAAETVAAIAMRFPDDAAIQAEAARARDIARKA